MADEKRRPYYDPTPKIIRAAEATLGILFKCGKKGPYIVKRPSDATMKRLPEKKV